MGLSERIYRDLKKGLKASFKKSQEQNPINLFWHKNKENPLLWLGIALFIWNLYGTSLFCTFLGWLGLGITLAVNAGIICLWFLLTPKRREVWKLKKQQEYNRQLAAIRGEKYKTIYEKELESKERAEQKKKEYYLSLSQFALELSEVIKHSEVVSNMMREKLISSTISNKQELLAQQEINDGHFVTVVNTYLEMKRHPELYENIGQRLSEGKRAIKKYDTANTEALRKLNEDNLLEFEIALRLI